MQISFSIDHQSKTLEVNCSGKLDFQEFLSLIKRVLDVAIKEKCYLVMVDGLEITEGNLPSHQRFFIGESIAKLWHINLKAAFLYPAKWTNKLVETVANNRGAHILVTHDIKKAKAWLYS